MKPLQKLFCLFYLFKLLHCESCQVQHYAMNCTGLYLKDCPKPNRNVISLIMDENQLETLLTENCEDWYHLISLSVVNNKLRTLSDLRNFKDLAVLELRKNFLTVLNLSSASLSTIDISHNEIKLITPTINLPHLEYFNISYNKLDHDNLNILIGALHSSPHLQSLDFSHNLVDRLPINLMTFGTTYLSYISFSANRLKTVLFNIFMDIHSPIFELDFSSNEIVNWSHPDSISIHSLDFSNNQISKIEASKFEFRKLDYIDLSRNPLTCICDESGPFVNWMHRNRKQVLHQGNTQCKFPPNRNLFNISCREKSSSPNPKSSSQSPSTSSSSSPSVSKSLSVNAHHTQVVIGIVIPAILILVALFVYVLFRHHRDQTGYRLLHQAPSFQASRIRVTGWLREKYLQFFSRSTESPGVQQEDDAPPTRNISDYLDNDESLNIICSSRDTSWIQQELVPALHLRHQIIDSKYKVIPWANFTLVVVNGKGCLQDRILIENLRNVLLMKDRTEIRLLIRRMPNLDARVSVNCLTDFVRRMIAEKCFFNYDDANQSVCVESLGFWLNLDL